MLYILFTILAITSVLLIAEALANHQIIKQFKKQSYAQRND
jgi:hypothetical protein